MLSRWSTQRDQDRLNALYGIVSCHDRAGTLFTPSYKISGPELYKTFTIQHIEATEGLGILNFAGQGSCDNFTLSKVGDKLTIHPERPQDDIPSWVADWRTQARPLTLVPYGKNDSNFSATASTPDYNFGESYKFLRVRARKVDRIIECGMPYHKSVCKALGIHAYYVFAS